MINTIQEVSKTLTDKYDLVSSAALRMSRIFLDQDAKAEGIKADPTAVTDEQAKSIEYMVSEPDMIALDDDRTKVGERAADLRAWMQKDGLDIQAMLKDAELIELMTHAADDAMSVKELAELTGLDRSHVLTMLEGE